MKKVAGTLLILLGVSLLGWVAYNLFIGMQPTAQGRNPIPPIILSAAFIFVGVKWIRGEST